MARWIIPCAGLASRWANGNAAKQLLAVTDDEPLLARTMRQIQAHDADADIVVVVRIEQRWDDMVAAWGGRCVDADLDVRRQQADKLASSAQHWSLTDRTFVLWGDVWWSDAAFDRVAVCESPWAAFLRFGPSRWTGCDHAEFFGFTFVPSEHARLHAAIDRTVTLAADGTLVDWSGGWQLFMAAAGADDTLLCGHDVIDDIRYRYGHHALHIDDFTEDFDYPDDVVMWRHAYESHQHESI